VIVDILNPKDCQPLQVHDWRMRGLCIPERLAHVETPRRLACANAIAEGARDRIRCTTQVSCKPLAASTACPSTVSSMSGKRAENEPERCLDHSRPRFGCASRLRVPVKLTSASLHLAFGREERLNRFVVGVTTGAKPLRSMIRRRLRRATPLLSTCSDVYRYCRQESGCDGRRRP
jgi:hypothetical protein